MRPPAFGIRARILLWHGLLLVMLLTAFGYTARRLHWENELQRIDRGLDEPVSILHSVLRQQNVPMRAVEEEIAGQAPPPMRYELPEATAAQFAARGWQHAVWTRHGRLLSSSSGLPEVLRQPPAANLAPLAIGHRSEGEWRMAYMRTPPGDWMLAAVSMTEETAAAARFGWLLLALGAGVLAAGLLMDAWLLKRAIQPVEEIISAAERISGGNLAARIETRAGGSELDRLAGVLNRTFAGLDQAFAQQARFSADVAHELRTPVAVLTAEAQTALERERSGEDYREALATCLRSARRMGGLIDSLLDLAQIQSGAGSAKEECDLAQLAAEVSDSIASMAASHGVEMTTELAGAACRGNAGQLAQVIANLLINAIQHNHPGGQVRVRTGQENGRAVLTVENTGPGIPQEDLPRVFERFYRADASRSRKTGGVGLGLAICKAIADAHGAELSVESRPQEWTRFSLVMPAA